MSLTSTCPACGATQKHANEARGQKAACRDCGERYVVRPTRPEQPDNTMTYIVGGLLTAVLVASGVLLYALVLRKKPVEEATTIRETPRPEVAATVASTPQTKAAPQPAVPAQSDKPAVLTSDQLRQAFATDPDGVERQHKGRMLEITGTITALQDLAPIRGVFLGSLQDPTPPVLCDLSADAAAFANLKPKQKVTIRGEFQGKTAEGFLGFIKCRVVGAQK